MSIILNYDLLMSLPVALHLLERKRIDKNWKKRLNIICGKALAGDYEYIEVNSKKIAVLRILKSRKNEALTSFCPFCGTQHSHGNVEGLRAAHCSDDLILPELKCNDGTILRKEDGYYLRFL